MSRNPIQILTVNCKTKYFRHKYWRYITDIGTFLMVNRMDIKVHIFKSLEKEYKNISEVLTVLERIERSDEYQSLTGDFIVFNKLTLCCFIDALLSSSIYTKPKPKLDEMVSEIITSTIMVGAKKKVASTNEELKKYLARETIPTLDEMIVEQKNPVLKDIRILN